MKIRTITVSFTDGGIKVFEDYHVALIGSFVLITGRDRSITLPVQAIIGIEERLVEKNTKTY